METLPAILLLGNSATSANPDCPDCYESLLLSFISAMLYITLGFTLITIINKEETLIEILADKYSRAIMTMTARKEYTTLELSQALDIPLATVYRKVKLLEDSELIQHVKTVVKRSGNEEKYYRCLLREATVRFRDGNLYVSLAKDESSHKIVRLWKKLSKPEG